MSLNSLGLVPNLDDLRNPPIDMRPSQQGSFHALIQKIYASCDPETPVPSGERLGKLRLQWRHCEPLVAAKMWAVEPLAQLFSQAVIHYTEQGNYLCALAVECFVALYCDPYRFTAPFSQARLKGLLMIAKILTNTPKPSERSSAGMHSGIVSVLERADEASLYEALLLMVVHYGPMGHSEEWAVLAEAKVMLKDVESIESRSRESSILHKES